MKMTDLPGLRIDTEAPFSVTDLKQWVYCPRVLYYYTCLPDIRPITYKMEAGIEAGESEEAREARRSLKAYGIERGSPLAHARREFNVRVTSNRLGLRGVVDMVLWLEDSKAGEVVPVDYKLSQVSGEHFKLQLAAYGMMLEEMSGLPARRGFLYSIPLRRAEMVRLDERLRGRLAATLETMHAMLWSESMPAPTPQHGKCLSCEFRRFCNDVL
jgi:CRISPR-associated exonuclease Cas4